MPTGIWEFRCSITDLDAAIAQYPHRKVDGWITFKREQVSPGFVRHHMSQDNLGDRLGTVELRGNEKLVEMCITSPAFLSSRDVTEEKLADMRASSDPDERRKKLMELLNKLSDDHREIARRRKEHFENVTSDLLQYLSQDWILAASATHASKAEGTQAAPDEATVNQTVTIPLKHELTTKYVASRMNKFLDQWIERQTSPSLYYSASAMDELWVLLETPIANGLATIAKIAILPDCLKIEPGENIAQYFGAQKMLKDAAEMWLAEDKQTASERIAKQEATTGPTWRHNGKTISDTVTSGSVIETSEGRFIQAKEMELPLDGISASPSLTKPPTSGATIGAKATDEMPDIPHRKGSLDRWKATWRAIREMAERATPIDSIIFWLQKSEQYKHLACHPDTLEKIIKAGKAGLLKDS